jgi:N,N'-diacetyllegionaminate synthase
MSKIFIIAEAGVNHNGQMELAHKLVEAAAEAGADYVKFQTFKTGHLVTSAAPKAAYQAIQQTSEPGESQYDMLRRLELDRNAHLQLIEHCKRSRIRFLSTAFDLESIDLLLEFGIGLFKIPSGEITNLPYLRKIGSLGKPVVLSTGMATMEEIKQALDILTTSGTSLKKITLLQCTTEYPAPMEEVNLKAMLSLGETFGVKSGFSDHTQGIEIAIAAAALGATIIEKHFTLNRSLPGPDHKASLEPHELKAMVKAIRNVEKALGSGVKEPSPSELKNLTAARKSIHLSGDLPAGHILTEKDLEMKRPGDGISPMQMDEIIGRKLKVKLVADTQLKMDQLQ